MKPCVLSKTRTCADLFVSFPLLERRMPYTHSLKPTYKTHKTPLSLVDFVYESFRLPCIQY